MSPSHLLRRESSLQACTECGFSQELHVPRPVAVGPQGQGAQPVTQQERLERVPRLAVARRLEGIPSSFRLGWKRQAYLMYVPQLQERMQIR